MSCICESTDAGTKLQFRLGGGNTAVDLFAHLVECRCVVADVEGLHRLGELFLQLGLFGGGDKLHRLGGALFHVEDVIVAGL